MLKLQKDYIEQTILHDSVIVPSKPAPSKPAPKLKKCSSTFYKTQRFSRAFIMRILKDKSLMHTRGNGLSFYIYLLSKAKAMPDGNGYHARIPLAALREEYGLSDRIIKEQLNELSKAKLIEWKVDNYEKTLCVKNLVLKNAHGLYKNNGAITNAIIKNIGFFFVDKKSIETCSLFHRRPNTRDIAMWLWLGTVYKDDSIPHSVEAPVFVLQDSKTTFSIPNLTQISSYVNCCIGCLHASLCELSQYFPRFSKNGEGTVIFNPLFAQYIYDEFTKLPKDDFMNRFKKSSKSAFEKPSRVFLDNEQKAHPVKEFFTENNGATILTYWMQNFAVHNITKQIKSFNKFAQSGSQNDVELALECIVERVRAGDARLAQRDLEPLRKADFNMFFNAPKKVATVAIAYLEEKLAKLSMNFKDVLMNFKEILVGVFEDIIVSILQFSGATCPIKAVAEYLNQ